MKNVTISGVKSSWTIPVNPEGRKLLDPEHIERVLDVGGLGGNSIEKKWLEFWLKNGLRFHLDFLKL